MKTADLVSFNFWKLLPLLLFFGSFLSLSSFAQRPVKNDYIVISDTIMVQGHISSLPENNNTEVFFGKSKRAQPVLYGIDSVTELRVSERVFFRKVISEAGLPAVVFLEKLPHSNEKAVFWKWNGKPNIFFLESSGKLQRLGENYQEVLKDEFANPDLDPLVDLTSLSEVSLVYFSRTSNTLQQPRTFTKLLGITPFVGFSPQKVGFQVPDSDFRSQISSSSPAIGLNLEVFLTFKRDLSLNVGGMWTQFDSQSFITYSYAGKNYESDVFLDFQTLQFPMTAKYYFDLKPNQFRVFGEVGYALAVLNQEKQGIYQAENSGQIWTTSFKPFELEQNFQGAIWGLGLEKYFSKGRALVLSIRGSKLSAMDQSIQGMTFSTGFKF